MKIRIKRKLVYLHLSRFYFSLLFWLVRKDMFVTTSCFRVLQHILGWHIHQSWNTIFCLSAVWSHIWFCRTRLLRANLLQPLKDIETINARLDCLVSVEYCWCWSKCVWNICKSCFRIKIRAIIRVDWILFFLLIIFTLAWWDLSVKTSMQFWYINHILAIFILPSVACETLKVHWWILYSLVMWHTLEKNVPKTHQRGISLWSLPFVTWRCIFYDSVLTIH